MSEAGRETEAAVAPPTPPVAMLWRRIALGGGGGMFVGMGLGRFSYTAMVPALIDSGQLTVIEAGQVGSVNLIGFCLGAMVSVPMARLAGRRLTLRLALAFAILGLAGSALPWGGVWLAACRGTLGVATALIMVLSLALIAETAPADRRPEAGAYVFAGVGLGIAASGMLVPWLLGHGLAAAWLGILGAGMGAAILALWGWSGSRETVGQPPAQAAMASARGPRRSIFAPGLGRLMVAHGLFSFGIVPHTIYWVDFLVRGRGLGTALAGVHWTMVGIAAAAGPLMTTMLARRVGTPAALVTGFAVLAIGIASPALWPAPIILIVSSLVFGAQPGLSSLLAARARDLGDAAEMPRVMRAMILANAAGGVLGGLTVPWIFAAAAAAHLPADAALPPVLAPVAVAGHAPLFLLGGAAMALGALFAWVGAAPHSHRPAGA